MDNADGRFADILKHVWNRWKDLRSAVKPSEDKASTDVKNTADWIIFHQMFSLFELKNSGETHTTESGMISLLDNLWSCFNGTWTDMDQPTSDGLQPTRHGWTRIDLKIY